MYSKAVFRKQARLKSKSLDSTPSINSGVYDKVLYNIEHRYKRAKGLSHFIDNKKQISNKVIERFAKHEKTSNPTQSSKHTESLERGNPSETKSENITNLKRRELYYDILSKVNLSESLAYNPKYSLVIRKTPCFVAYRKPKRMRNNMKVIESKKNILQMTSRRAIMKLIRLIARYLYNLYENRTVNSKSRGVKTCNTRSPDFAKFLPRHLSPLPQPRPPSSIILIKENRSCPSPPPFSVGVGRRAYPSFLMPFRPRESTLLYYDVRRAGDGRTGFSFSKVKKQQNAVLNERESDNEVNVWKKKLRTLFKSRIVLREEKRAGEQEELPKVEELQESMHIDSNAEEVFSSNSD